MIKNFFWEVWAVALRDLKKRSTFLKFIGMISLTIGIFLLIGYAFESFIDFSEYGDSSYVEFFYAGMIIYSLVLSGLQISLELITDKNGFIRILLVAPISKYSILFGKILSGFISSLKGLFVMIVFFLIMFDKLNVIRIFEILFLMFFVIVSYNGLGLWLSSLFKNRDVATQIIGYLSGGIFLLSGIIYPIQAMPTYVQYFFYINPVAYTVDLFRYIMIGENFFPVLLSISFSLVFGVVSVLLGTYMFDRSQRK